MSLYHVIFKKKFGTISIKPLIKYVVILIAVYIPIAAIAFTSNLLTKTDKNAAILLSAHAFSDYDYWAPPFGFLGSYPAWTWYFNARGEKIDYFFAATKADFMNVLTDPKYQSIVLVGHGSYNMWRATDDQVANYDIEAMQGKFQKKEGEWFQLSCADPDFSPVHIGELVMAKKNVYHYNGPAGSLDFILDALTAFRHIKKYNVMEK
ncbi:hypothetical protein [Candidatus Electronema sp. JM]|uniref:hypothetical protein n=1 Tax=Candidatus Electronema sp. JM TaxID=3401571 RepID=UPI003AA7ED73